MYMQSQHVATKRMGFFSVMLRMNFLCFISLHLDHYKKNNLFKSQLNIPNHSACVKDTLYVE